MTSRDNRDNFTQTTVDRIGRRAGYVCSRPGCGKPTAGPSDEPAGSVNIGVAAHIHGASPGGPRYDEAQTRQERRSPDNGVWLCQDDGKLVDDDPTRFTAAVLRQWKHDREEQARRIVGRRPLESSMEPAALNVSAAVLLRHSDEMKSELVAFMRVLPRGWEHLRTRSERSGEFDWSTMEFGRSFRLVSHLFEEHVRDDPIVHPQLLWHRYLASLIHRDERERNLWSWLWNRLASRRHRASLELTGKNYLRAVADAYLAASTAPDPALPIARYRHLHSYFVEHHAVRSDGASRWIVTLDRQGSSDWHGPFMFAPTEGDVRGAVAYLWDSWRRIRNDVRVKRLGLLAEDERARTACDDLLRRLEAIGARPLLALGPCSMVEA